MAYIKSKIAWWAVVADAVIYNIRLVTPNAAIDYTKTPDLTVPPPTDPNSTQVEVDLGPTGAKGTFDVLITAQDSAGNESDPLDLQGAVLNFVPPAAPSDGGWR